MTPQPKRKHSTQRKGKRLNARKAEQTLTKLVSCKNCNRPKLAHRICKSCSK